MENIDKKEVEEYLKDNTPDEEESFFHYSDQDIWREGFRFGIEYAEIKYKELESKLKSL
jgi:hypothetical protein